MKLTIALTATAFLLGGCLESSDSTPNNQLVVTPDEVVIPPDVINSPDIVNPPDIINPPQGADAVASMLVNNKDSADEFLDYWACSVVGEDAPFTVVLDENGDGATVDSEEVIGFTWSEQPNGTLIIDIADADFLIEWTNFEFINLFEITAELYQGGVLVERNRCVLTDASDTVDSNGAEDYFVTALSANASDSVDLIWQCDIGAESIFFFFYADNTGVIGFTDLNENGEPELMAEVLDDWRFVNGSLQTSILNDANILGDLVTLDAITTIDSTNFDVGNVVIVDENFGSASCSRF